ncbi:MAG: zinc ribbon domain-containing protein [Proteobacteria bacterium]|jgi:putative FmdB family regulatory protein|nr:zinc ribbon domain-containing protein [Pseudomonadota bacterium]MDA1299863.1 zinc ribbon domain-containing protein [Pseudomonadota bacterium]
MPIYEYQCSSCDHELEKLQKISDQPLSDCPACGKATLKKKISAAAFRLKGSGWYETDFKTGKKKNIIGGASGDGGSDASQSSGGDGTSGSSSDSKSTESKKSPAKDSGSGTSAGAGTSAGSGSTSTKSDSNTASR